MSACPGGKAEIDWPERLEQLDALVAEYRGRYRYDCLVPFSGGKDSTDSLNLMKRYPGLKPLWCALTMVFCAPISGPAVIGFSVSSGWMCMISPLAGKWSNG